MKKLTLKWKFFLVISYLLVVIISLSIIGVIVALAFSKNTSSTPSSIMISFILFIGIILSGILNIYIVNRYFPDNALSPKIKRLLNISCVIMIIASLFMGLIFAITFSTLFDPSEKHDFIDLLSAAIFGPLFIFCLYSTILQFQISRYLNKRTSGTINQLIDSIGT
jgi:hypothetical protein